MIREWQMEHQTNVVVVNNQSANSKIFLLLFDWMLSTTTFIPWDILWAMLIVFGVLIETCPNF